MLIETQNTPLKTETQATVTPLVADAKPSKAAGLIAGTLVETAAGWRRVELLRVGDHVQTYDGGLKQLRRIERAYYGADHGGYGLEQTLHVPGGALDNCEDLIVMPDQLLMIESEVAAKLLGEFAVLLPASALAGYRGITRQPLQNLIEAITLKFDDEEVIYANSGLLAHCGNAPQSDFFTTLDHTRATALLSLMGKDHDLLDRAIATLNSNEPDLLEAA